MVSAAENAAHAGDELLADPVAEQPGAGAALTGGTLVCRVRLGADDDDLLMREAMVGDAEVGEVSVIEDEQRRLVGRKSVGELVRVPDRSDPPAVGVALEQVDDQTPERGMRDGDHDAMGAGAHRALLLRSLHAVIVGFDEVAAIRARY